MHAGIRCQTVDLGICKAFTLIELLVVISIITLLIAILLPALKNARVAGQMSKSLSNLRQVSIAHFMYADDNRGSLIHYQELASVSDSKLYWDGRFMALGYLGSRGVLWSPGRDISALNMTTTVWTAYNPWRTPGYGMNRGMTGIAELDEIPLNLNQNVPFQLSDALLMIEAWTNSNGQNLAGSLSIKRQKPATPVKGPFLFTYNGGAARSYLDGHANGSNGQDLGWLAIDSYHGEWIDVPFMSKENRLKPWYDEWRTHYLY